MGASPFDDVDIGSVLLSDGPIVQCVLLRSQIENSSAKKSCEVSDKETLHKLIKQIPVDTTPKKSMVANILGGPFTFLGQYEDEGTMLMIKRTDDNSEDNVKGMRNPHVLQPPFENTEVYGDILIMRVAPIDEVTMSDQDCKEKNESCTIDQPGPEGPEKVEENSMKSTQADINDSDSSSNKDFFLDYTKEEYLKFSARTDVVPPNPIPDECSEEDIASDDNSESSEEFVLPEEGDSEEESDDEDSVGMMNLILGQILKKFREQNGRGPDTQELLNMRSALAEKLGVDVPAINEEEEGESVQGDESEKEEEIVEEEETKITNVSKKRDCDDGSIKEGDKSKRVKFDIEIDQGKTQEKG